MNEGARGAGDLKIQISRAPLCFPKFLGQIEQGKA